MVKVCAVKSCTSGREKKYKIKKMPYSFYQPRTPTRLRSWEESLGMALKPSDNICQFHFKQTDIKMYEKIVIGDVVYFLDTLRKGLKENAIPTVEHQFQLDHDSNQRKLIIEEHKPKRKQQQQPKQEKLQQPKQEKLQQPKQEKQQFESDIVDSDEHKQDQQKTLEIMQPIEYLKQKLSVLPPHWLYYVGKPNQIGFMRLNPVSKQLQNHIILNDDLSITVVCSNNEEVSLGKKISSPDEIYKYLKSVEKWPLCFGTQFERQRFSKRCKGVIFGNETYKRNQMNPRCKACRALRRQLQSRYSTGSSTLKNDNNNDKLSKLIAKQRAKKIRKLCKHLETKYAALPDCRASSGISLPL